MPTIRTTRPEELLASARLALAQPGVSSRQVTRQVEALFAHTGRAQLSPAYQLVVAEGDRLLTACICIESPGRTAILFLPTLQLYDETQGKIAAMLAELMRRMRDGGVRVLQCLLWPPVAEDEALLREAGFDSLAQLIYLDRQLGPPRRRGRRVNDGTAAPLRWDTYGPVTHALFAETIEATYEKSLDCPKLNGTRGIEDVLAGHKATGTFDGADWFVAWLDDRPAGVILLARVPHRPAMEVVYMGVVPWARGRRVGSGLLDRALDCARERDASHLTLAVDAMNTPALRLYEQFGFFESGRRNAWIALL